MFREHVPAGTVPRTSVNARVVAQWIRPLTLNHEVPGSNLLAAPVVPSGKALYPHCLVSQKGLNAIGPLVACIFKAACFRTGQVK